MRKTKSKIISLLLTISMILSNLSIVVYAQENNEIRQWNYRSFGQSVDVFFNNVSNGPGQNGINYAWLNPTWAYKNKDYIQTPADIDSAIKYNIPVNINNGDTVVVESRGGKIANGHDGITFLYTTIPTDVNFEFTAKVTVEAYGPHPNNPNGTTSLNNQSSAGIMARDNLGEQRQNPQVQGFEELPAASNFSAAGYMRKNSTTKELTIGTLFRDGVVSSTGSVGANYIRSASNINKDIQPNIPYIYKLERCDDGFYITILNEDGSILFNRTKAGEADLVTRLDKDNMYVGFFASREHRISATNINLVETGKNNSIKTNPPSPAAPNPSLTIKSPTTYANSDYTFTFVANYDGNITMTKGSETITKQIKAYTELYVPTTLSSGNNSYSVVYTPMDNKAPNTNPVSKTHIVDYTTIPTSTLDAIYVSPNGLGDGTKENPTSLENAINIVLPGQTIYLNGGTYTPTGNNITIENNLSGLPDKYKKIMPLDGAVVNITKPIALKADYWHLYNFTIGGTQNERIQGNVLNILGNFNIAERLITEYGTDSGLHIGSPSTSDTIVGIWPKYNLIKNCESRYNVDPAGNNADGFAAKRVGYGNVFYGCEAHHNVDDGYDFFTWVATGSSMPITVENCVAYENDHNGFKLGGEGQPSNHIVKNSLSFKNVMAGFSDNFNPGNLRITNCISVDNLDQNYLLRDNTYIKPTNVVTNSISYRTNKGIGKVDSISGSVVNSSIFKDGEATINGYTLTDSDFVSVIAPTTIIRNEKGDIVWEDYMKVKKDSPLTKAGTNGSNIGISFHVESELTETIANANNVLKTDGNILQIVEMISELSNAIVNYEK